MRVHLPEGLMDPKRREASIVKDGSNCIYMEEEEEEEGEEEEGEEEKNRKN